MNKNFIGIALTAVLFSACEKPKTITFDVSAPGLTSGVFVVKTLGAQAVFGDNFKAGKASAKGMLGAEGFYNMDVVKDGDKPHLPFEVYLEPGAYTVTVNADNLQHYPKIVTNSKKQQEINNYMALYDQLGNNTQDENTELNRRLQETGNKLSTETYQQLVMKIAVSNEKEKGLQYNVLEQYVKQYPQSELAAHFMIKQNYAESPEKYLGLFNKLSPTAKNSADGKEIGKALAVAVTLQPGKKAPTLAGKTSDGKLFSTITAGKKIFLVDFWRSANQFSRENHEKILKIYPLYASRGFEVISVSLDKNALWWSTALKADKLPWPQMSDLKGDDSPNAANWSITTIPTYYLVDSNWKIYKNNIDLGSVEVEVKQYLEKHH